MTTKEMNLTNMNIKDFIDYIITFDNIDDILDNCKTQSEKGFIFERLFDIVIKFGFCNEIKIKLFFHKMYDNIYYNVYKINTSILEKVLDIINKIDKLSDNKTKEPIKKPVKKQTIPKPLKKLVWNKYIGEEIGKTKCLCCKLTYITQLSFHCGHIISEKNGGEMEIDNLKPICQSCNSSMGIQNMDEFIKKYNL